MTTSLAAPQVSFPVRRLSQHEILIARLAGIYPPLEAKVRDRR